MATVFKPIEGGVCEKCAGRLGARDGRISCIDCGTVHGLVELAAQVRAHHAAILSEIPTNTRRTGTTKRGSRREQAMARLNNQSLFDPIIRPSSNNRNGLRPSANNSATSSPKRPRIRLGRTRSDCCDRLLVVRTNKVICPACGVIFADIGILNLLRDELGAVPCE